MKAEIEPQWAKELKERLARVEKLAGPRLESEMRRIAEDEQWHRCKSISEMPPVERVQAMAKLSPPECRRVWQFLDGAGALATLKAATPAVRERIKANCPEGLLTEALIETLPAPARVRIRLRSDVTSWKSSAIKGPRKADDYPGVKLVSATAATTEAGRCEAVYPRSTFDRMLEIDGELAAAVDAGVVLVEEVGEAESRALLRQEIAALGDKGPRLVI